MALTPSIDFLSRLRKIDRHDVKTRDVIIMWAVAREPGMMGQELARKIGFEGRSNVQICLRRLLRMGLVEDRRARLDNRTPNDLYITPKGEAMLADVVPSDG